MPYNYRNRSKIKEQNPDIFEALEDITATMESMGQQVNASSTGVISSPPSISSLQVTAAQGIFDAAIGDNNSPVVRGINYFLEYSTSPTFVAPHVIDLGSSRNWRGFLGNQVFYFRAYSAYPTSPRSDPTYYGTPTVPTAVQGGGTATGPVPLASQGSGTTQGSSGSDGGFGNQPFRGPARPITS